MNKPAKKRKTVAAAGQSAGDGTAGEVGTATSETNGSRSLHHLINYSKNTIIAALALMDELVNRMNFSDISSKLLHTLPLESTDVVHDKTAINLFTEGLWALRISRNRQKSGKIAINTIISTLKLAVSIAHYIVSHQADSADAKPLIEYTAAVTMALVTEMKNSYNSSRDDEIAGSLAQPGVVSHRSIFDSFIELVQIMTESAILTSIVRDDDGLLNPHINSIAMALCRGLVMISVDIPVKKRFEIFTGSLLSLTLQYYECMHVSPLQHTPPSHDGMPCDELSEVIQHCFGTLLFSVDDENLFDELMSISLLQHASGGRGYKKSYYHGIFDAIGHCVASLRLVASIHTSFSSIYLLYQVFGKASLTYSSLQVQQNTASMHHDAVQLLAHRKHCQRLLHVCFLFINANQFDALHSSEPSTNPPECMVDVAGIHYQLLMSLAESLKLAGSSVIPNHESLQPYILYLKEYAHSVLKHIQWRVAPSVLGSRVITTLVDILRQLVSIDHHVLTDNIETDTKASPLTKIISTLERVRTDDQLLVRSSHQLLSVIIELYSDLRKTDELILLLISHAGGSGSLERDSATGTDSSKKGRKILTNAPTTANSLLCLLLDDPQINQQILGMFQRLPIGQINHVWVTLSQSAHRFTYIQCILVCCYCVATRDFASNQFNNVPVNSILDIIMQLIAVINSEFVGSRVDELPRYYYRIVESFCALLDLLCGIIPYRSSSNEDGLILVNLYDAITSFITQVVAKVQSYKPHVLLTLFPVVLNACRVINTIDAYSSDQQHDVIDLAAPTWAFLGALTAQFESLDATKIVMMMDYILRLDRIVPVSSVSQDQVLPLIKITKAYVSQAIDVKEHMDSQRYLSLLDSPLLTKIVPHLMAQQYRELVECIKGFSAIKKRKNGVSTSNTAVIQSIKATTTIITLFEPLVLPTSIEDMTLLKDIIVLITSLSPGVIDEVYVLLGVVCSCICKSRQSMYDQHAMTSWNDALRPLLSSHFPQLLQTMQYLTLHSKAEASALAATTGLLIDSLFTHLLKHQNIENNCDDMDLCDTVSGGIRSVISDSATASTLGVHILRALSTTICSLDYNYLYQDSTLTATAQKLFQEYQSTISSVLARDAPSLRSSDLLVLADCCRVVNKFSAHDGDYISTYKVSLETVIRTKCQHINTGDSQCIHGLLLLVGSICALAQRTALSADGLELQLNRVFLILQHVICNVARSESIDLVPPFELCLRHILQCSQLANHTHIFIKFMDKLAFLDDSRGLNCVLTSCRLLLEYSSSSNVSTTNSVIDVVIQMLESIATRQPYIQDVENVMFYCETMKSMVEYIKSKSSSSRDSGATHQPLLGTCLMNSCCYMASHICSNRHGDSEGRSALGGISIVLKCMEALLTIPSCSILFTTNVSSLLTIIHHTVQLIISNKGAAKDDVYVSCLRSVSKVLKTVATSNELMKHAYIFVTVIITAMSESVTISNSARDVLYNGIFCLLEKCKAKEKSLIVSQLSPTAKVLYSTIHLIYQEEWKFIGKA